MSLGEAIVIALSSLEFTYIMIFLLSVTVLYIFFYFSGKTKDKKYSEEMTDSEYTLRYSRKDMAKYIASAVLLILLSTMLLALLYLLPVDRSFSSGVLALYFMVSLTGIPGIVCAVIYTQRLKWKAVVSGDAVTVYKILCKPRKYSFSDIVTVGKRFYHSASRGYGGITVLCYSVYVRNSEAQAEKAFEVHKLFTGFDKFEAHLISLGISPRVVRKKGKAAAKFLFLMLFLVPSIAISLICIINDVGLIGYILSSALCLTSFYLVKLFLSTVYFTKEGVKRKLFFVSYILIQWNRCVEIGIGGSGDDKIYDCMYFSKVPLTDEQIKSISTLKQNREHLWCACDDAMIAEVLQYVDKDRIKNLDLYESIVFE